VVPAPAFVPVDEPMPDADADDILADVFRHSRRLLCRTADAPRVWSTDDERHAAGRMRDEVDAAVPVAMCAVCARRRPQGEVSCVPIPEVPSLHLLSASGESTLKLPRDSKTTVAFDDMSTYCMHPAGEHAHGCVISFDPVPPLNALALTSDAIVANRCRCRRRRRLRVCRVPAVSEAGGDAPGQPGATGHGPMALRRRGTAPMSDVHRSHDPGALASAAVCRHMPTRCVGGRYRTPSSLLEMNAYVSALTMVMFIDRRRQVAAGIHFATLAARPCHGCGAVRTGSPRRHVSVPGRGHPGIHIGGAT
jgi:hypothetical protein